MFFILESDARLVSNDSEFLFWAFGFPNSLSKRFFTSWSLPCSFPFLSSIHPPLLYSLFPVFPCFPLSSVISSFFFFYSFPQPAFFPPFISSDAYLIVRTKKNISSFIHSNISNHLSSSDPPSSPSLISPTIPIPLTRLSILSYPIPPSKYPSNQDNPPFLVNSSAPHPPL